MGYHRAGFDVVGVDIEPQPNYPFEFIQDDAISFLRSLLWGRQRGMRGRWRAVHLSPPCQASTALTKGTNKGREYPQLIPVVRELMQAMQVSRVDALPYVVENVQGSDLRRDVTLCGEYFGLDVIRHRYFEIEKAFVPRPVHKKHRGRVRGYRHGKWYDGPYFAVYGEGGGKGTIEEWRAAMGIDWMQTRHELAESIPPAYTEYIGGYLMDAVNG